MHRNGDGGDLRTAGRKQERSKKEKKKHKKSKSDDGGGGGSSNGGSSRKRGKNERASPPPHSDDDERGTRRRPIPSDRDSRGRNEDGRRDDASLNRKRPRDAGGRNGFDEERTNIAGGGGGGGGSSERSWLRANIRVRVVHKSYAGGRAYLGKGKVVDVPRMGEATVRMDLGNVVVEGELACPLPSFFPSFLLPLLIHSVPVRDYHKRRV